MKTQGNSEIGHTKVNVPPDTGQYKNIEPVRNLEKEIKANEDQEDVKVETEDSVSVDNTLGAPSDLEPIRIPEEEVRA